MGAVAISNVQDIGIWEYEPNKRAVVAKVTMSSSYATGGDTVDNIGKLGLRRVTGFLVNGQATSGTYNKIKGTTIAVPVQAYNTTLAGTQTSPTIKLQKGGTTPVEETAATNVATHIFWAVFIGEV